MEGSDGSGIIGVIGGVYCWLIARNAEKGRTIAHVGLALCLIALVAQLFVLTTAGFVAGF